jgi:hypothetical protein
MGASMRLAWVIVALVLLVVGGLFLSAEILLNPTQTIMTTDEAGTAGDFSPPASLLTPMTAEVQWEGGTSSTVTYLVTNNYGGFGFACGGGGTLVAVGQGASGSFSAGVDGGKTYLFYGCDGSKPETLSFTITLTGGITVGEVLAGIPIVAGGVALYVGVRGRTADAAEAERVLGPRDRSGPP